MAMLHKCLLFVLSVKCYKRDCYLISLKVITSHRVECSQEETTVYIRGKYENISSLLPVVLLCKKMTLVLEDTCHVSYQ